MDFFSFYLFIFVSLKFPPVKQSQFPARPSSNENADCGNLSFVGRTHTHSPGGTRTPRKGPCCVNSNPL